MLIPANKIGLPCPAVLSERLRPVKRAYLYNLIWLLLASCSIFFAPQVAAANKKPIAVIAKITPVREGATVTLDGSASKDKDGSIASYTWKQTKGLATSLNNPDSAIASFTAPILSKTQKPTKPITLSFKLTVTDNSGASKSRLIKVLVKPNNAPPVANAGADQSVTLNTQVNLNASGSTDDGQIVQYVWKQINASQANKVKLTGAKTAQATFTSPNKAATLEFQLKVTDNDRKSAVDTIKISVSNSGGNGLNATFNTNKTTLNQGTNLLASVDAINGGTAPYSVTFDWGDGTTADQSTLETGVTAKSVTHTYAAIGSYTLTTTVTDANGGSKTNTQLITVIAPALNAEFHLNHTVILEGDSLIASANNISGGSAPYKVKYEWGDGAAAEEFTVSNGGNSQSANHSYAAAGTYSLTITVTDGNNGTKTFTVDVSVEVADPLGEC